MMMIVLIMHAKKIKCFIITVDFQYQSTKLIYFNLFAIPSPILLSPIPRMFFPFFCIKNLIP